MAIDLGGLLQQYLGAAVARPAGDADHFHQVAQSAPPEVVSQGLAEAFRSDRTPPFGQMVGQLFAQGTPDQQAGMLKQLLGSLGPGALTAPAAISTATGIAADARPGGADCQSRRAAKPGCDRRHEQLLRAALYAGEDARQRGIGYCAGQDSQSDEGLRRRNLLLESGRYAFMA